MNVSVKDAGSCRKTMSIELPAEKVAEERKETLGNYIRFASIPGFRKGKAPAHVVEKKYSREIGKDLEERVVPKYYHAAVKESALKVVNVVEVSEVKIEPNQPFTFEVTVDVEPEFKLPKYTDIPVMVQAIAVTDEQVQQQIDALRNQYASFDEVEGKTVEQGDMAQITYSATIDGTPLQDAIPEAKGIGAGSGYWISADEHAFLPGMGEAVVGLKQGDTKEVSVSFPAGFVVKELANVTALYAIEVTGVRVRTLPAIDESFLKRLHLDSEAALRERIREQLQQQAENAILGMKHEQIVNYLIQNTELEVPESVVQQQSRNVMYDIARQRMMTGLTEDQIAEQRDDIFKEAQERALENVKLRYIGLAIAGELGFEAAGHEIDEEIAIMAIHQRKDARSLRKELEESGSISSISEQIRFNKALDYMVEYAKTK